MEQHSSFDSFELQFTHAAQGYLRETAKWATFLSILGFIVIGFYVIAALGMFAAGGAASEMEGMEGMQGMGMMGAIGGVGMGIAYLLGAALYFFPVLYLYRFASSAKEALNNNNTEQLTACFENLKSHYKYLGIVTIVGIVLAILAVIMIIVAFGAAAAGGM